MKAEPTYKRIKRYKDFTEAHGVVFSRLFENDDFDVVQVHDMTPCGKDIIGFAGCFKWKDNTIVSLDGDIYSEDMNVIAYKKGSFEGKKCLDILVEEW